MKNMVRKSGLIFLLAVLLPLMLFVFPMWRITLSAPQYPGGITMYIWISQITGETESTIQNINILNHYIGMKFIEPDSIPELTYFPYVIMAMVGLGLIGWFTGNRKVFLTWTIILLILGILGMYDFYLWMYDYGHNLDPKAPIKVEGMSYQPPLIGSKWLLNFKADSWPHIGGIALGISILLGFAAFFIAKKENEKIKIEKKMANKKIIPNAAIFISVVVLSLTFTSCSQEKVPIVYGEDHCVHCMMKIVQPQYGAQIMSKKGKAYKFDAIECLIDFTQKGGIAEADIRNEYVTPFTTPETLQNATTSYYLRTPMLPSPMGMFLTALQSEEEAEQFQAEHGGELYSWNELKSNFDNLPAMACH
jgi:copper chaperone NosL